MTDVHDKQTRSYNMSQIKGKNTKPEMLVRKFLFSKGLRYRLHCIHLPGKPDIVLPKYNTLIFINGCFWHGHENCSKFIIPKSNNEYWLKKIESNKERDQKNLSLLHQKGWQIITVWECQIINKKNRELYMNEILEKVKLNLLTDKK